MTAWQYAQLSITRDIRAGEIRTILWRAPGQGAGENFTGSGQSVLELLNRGGCRWLGAGRPGRARGPRRWAQLLGPQLDGDDLHLQVPGSELVSQAAARRRRAAEVPVVSGNGSMVMGSLGC